MKVIIHTNPTTGMLCIDSPSAGCRLALGVVLPDGSVVVAPVPVPADALVGRWWEPGTVFDWTETEGEWLTRVAAQVVPVVTTSAHPLAPVGSVLGRHTAEALGVTFDQLAFRVIDSSAIPPDGPDRGAWADTGTAVVVDPVRKAYLLANPPPNPFGTQP